MSTTMLVRGWTCTIRGRVDGLSREGERLVVEEVKTSLMDGTRLEALELAELGAWCEQLSLYLHLLSAQGGEPVVGRLVVLSLADGWQRFFMVQPDPSLEQRLREQLRWLVGRREALLADRRRRRSCQVPFPHGAMRAGQEEILARAAQVLREPGHLLLQAPTGIGKTAAVLCAALRVAYATDRRVFFATARTTQQLLAADTLEAMVEQGLFMRAVVLSAREKVCINQRLECHPERCSYARGHYDRVRQGELLERLLKGGVNRPQDLERVARQAHVCPHALARDLVERSDVVVGDYNYVFDPFVALRSCSGGGADRDPSERWFVLVDEAHNLVERARDWLSPALRGARLGAAARHLEALGEQFQPYAGLLGELQRAVEEAVCGAGGAFADGTAVVELDEGRFHDLRARFDSLLLDYALAMGPQGAAPARLEDPYLRICSDLMRFCQRLEQAGEESVALHRPDPAGADLRLFCRDPASYLGPCFQQLAGSIAFSATLEPLEHHRRWLGLPPQTERLSLPSPFDPALLQVVVGSRVSTRFRHRERDRLATRELVRRVMEAIPGNCAILFPSFAMRDRVVEGMGTQGRQILLQQPAMEEDERKALLESLERPASQPRVLLGVLGGIFAEGVDLPGEALLGVVIVGPALPPVTPERELIRGWCQERWGRGFHHAYLVPGMTRVIQAAGRVVRTDQDYGVVVLVGQRFVQHDFARFFPPDWSARRSSAPWEDVASFFRSMAQGALSAAGSSTYHDPVLEAEP